MKEFKHKFFSVLKEASRKHGFEAFAGKHVNQPAFFRSLKQAHPFVFDSKCSEAAMERSSNYQTLGGAGGARALVKIRDVETEISQTVEDFSLPFSHSAYLLTNPATVFVNPRDGGAPFSIRIHGYLIEEKTPEKFLVYVVHEICPPKSVRDSAGLGDDTFLPIVDQFEIDLTNLDLNPEETTLIAKLTTMISVKRIGIEHGHGGMNFKTGGSGLGITTVKYDNIYHIADKVEYDYSTPVIDGEIQYEYTGFWRGHWRAFYVKDSHGNNVKNAKGWNVVDYGKTGKNRLGERNVPGYTWVIEHTKGDPKLAEIKKRVVRGR